MRRVIKQKETLLQPIRLITLTNPSSAAAEHYRTIRTNIQFVSINDQQVKTIVVTSSGPGEGNRPRLQIWLLSLQKLVRKCY